MRAPNAARSEICQPIRRSMRAARRVHAAHASLKFFCVRIPTGILSNIRREFAPEPQKIMSKKQAATYTKFLQLAQAIRQLPSFPTLDPVEERLLHQLATAWYNGEKVPVLRAMEMSPDVSGTTVHRRLKTLRSKGMIALMADEADDRVRYVVPTDLTNQYFTKMGQYLDKASRG